MVASSAGSVSGLSFEGSSWLTTAAQEAIITPIQEQSGHLDWYAAQPVTTGSLSFTGILVGVIDTAQSLGPVFLSVTNSTSSSILLQAVGPDHLLIFSSTMTAQSDAQMIQQGALTQRVDTPAVDSALQGSGKTGTVSYGQGKSDTIAGYTLDLPLGWAIVASEPSDVALASVANQQANASLALLGGALVLVVLLLVVSMRLTRPLGQMAATARRIAAGDLSARVDRAGPVEISTLAESFNLMVERLGGLITRVQLTSLELAEFRSRAVGCVERAGGQHRPAELGGDRDLGEHGRVGQRLDADRRHRRPGGGPGHGDQGEPRAGSAGHPSHQ